tara:strand:- start:44095 stop:44688 length:594 start_codon:yes stop_codon:yes gene_type:complete
MTVSLATDSAGNTYQLWAQRQANSCAVASIWMARGIARQMSIDESEWELANRMYNQAIAGMSPEGGPPPPGAPMSLDPGSYDANQSSMANTFASTGVYARQVADMLRQEGFNVRHMSARSVLGDWLTPTRPAIILVGWYPQGKGQPRRGGHFIVAAAKRRDGRIVYLDPWGGVLREVRNNGRYPQTGIVEEAIYFRD